ncbi:hypothetical protein [Frankia sp. AgKG'84/4]|nr:hypothetical protein [Frankia sp. AgKG'84/4]
MADFVFLRYEGDGRVPAIVGRYCDEIVRVDDGWPIARREVRTVEKPG